MASHRKDRILLLNVPGSSGKSTIGEALTRTRLGYHRVVAGRVAVGNESSWTTPLGEAWRLDDLLALIDG